MDSKIEWLLAGPSWVNYRTQADLMGKTDGESDLEDQRLKMVAEPGVQGLLSELDDWPGEILNSHKSANQLFHKLNFLADLGFKAGDPGMDAVIVKILKQTSSQGPFKLPMNISTHFGGSGSDIFGWALCDAPLQVYALNKLGLSEHPDVQKALQYLSGLVRENGWPCTVSPELGSFRGPGRKSDPCPYANLAMLKALSQVKHLIDSPQSRQGVETLLYLWENRQDQHPYQFYMGTDFCKLKAPLNWYDLLHVLDTLSLFPWVYRDSRYQDMLAVLQSKANSDGLYCAESIYNVWNQWEFGQKKTPSRWITFLALRIIMRTSGL